MVTVRGISRRGGVKERMLGGEVHCIYTHKDRMMKPTKHCLKEGEDEEGNGRIM
jgi:hypothetical protein